MDPLLQVYMIIEQLIVFDGEVVVCMRKIRALLMMLNAIHTYMPRDGLEVYYVT